MAGEPLQLHKDLSSTLRRMRGNCFAAGARDLPNGIGSFSRAWLQRPK